MSLRTVLHIPTWIFKAVAWTIIVGVMGYFALTRTEVGRDGLRAQVENQFNAQFEGELRIGSLTGNLIYDLYATDVELLDPAGDVVVRIDSVTARPSWREMFNRRLLIRQLNLLSPDVQLVRHDDYQWNINKALAPRRSGAGSELWSFVSSNINVENGRFRTHNESSTPEIIQSGHIFDYTHTEVEDIDLSVTLEWNTESRLIDIYHVSAHLPALELSLDHLRGQIIYDDGRLSLNDLALSLDGRTELDLTAALGSLEAFREERWNDVDVFVDLTSAALDFDQLGGLFPVLPVRDQVRLAGSAVGSLDNLSLTSFSVERGRSAIAADGHVFGLPGPVTYELTTLEASLDAEDLYALYPHDMVDRYRGLEPVELILGATGTAARNAEGQITGTHDLDLSLDGSFGSLSGPLKIRTSDDDALHYEGELLLEQVNLAAIALDQQLQSNLNGRILVDASGHRTDELRGVMSAYLSHSTLAGRTATSLNVNVGFADRRLDAIATLQQPPNSLLSEALPGTFSLPGEISATVTVDWYQEMPRYDISIDARNANLGDLLRVDSLHTAINGTLAIQGQDTRWDHTRADIALEADSSIVKWSNRLRVVPPYMTALYLSEASSGEPRISMEGDVGTFFLRGDVRQAPLAALSSLWLDAFSEAVQRQVDKPYLSRALATANSEQLDNNTTLPSALIPPDHTAAQERVRNALKRVQKDTLQLEANFNLYRLDILTSLLPMLPHLEGGVRGSVRTSANADHFSTEGTLQASSLVLEHVSGGAARANIAASGSLSAPLEETLQAQISLEADSARFGDVFLEQLSLNTHLLEREAYFAFTSHTNGEQGPLQTEGSLQLLPERNRLLFDYIELNTGSLAWESQGASIIDLYADAVSVDDFSLSSRHPRTDHAQEFRASGVLSNTSDDTLNVKTHRLGLRALSDAFLGGLSIGGLLNAEVSLTNMRSPELTGTADVEAFSYDNRLLGKLEASSQYAPGQPGIALSVRLAPTEEERERTHIYGTSIPARFEENRLEIEGLFNLPQFDELGSLISPSEFDLAFEAERIDAFFFDYLFPDVIQSVDGAFEGSGRITGSFTHPLFDASFVLSDGFVEVPYFDLAYEVAGPVTVDQEGFHLEDVEVTDPTGGSAYLNGAILFNDYEFFSFDLSGQLDELRIMNVREDRDLPFYGQIWASGPATLTGPVWATTLRTTNAVTSPRSEVYIPVTEGSADADPGFIVFADSLEQRPEWTPTSRRAHILADRPVTERPFLDGMDLDLSFSAPRGSTVNLVFDPLLGDIVRAVGSGRIQLQRTEGDYFTYGTFEVDSGDYLFTAGEVFVRRFNIDAGSITWDGDPIDAQLDIRAAYRTRASRAGLTGGQASGPPIPLAVMLHITGRVSTPEVDLDLRVDQQDRTVLAAEQLQTILSQPGQKTEYATSVLLTNSFLLTTESGEGDFIAGSAFNSVSQLVSSQLNRYLNQVLPNVDFTFGVQGDESVQDLDVTYGLALRLLDERLIIRGQGVYTGGHTRASDDPAAGPDLQHQGLQGEFMVELRLSPRVAVEVFYRREGDLLNVNQFTNTTGAGLSYQTRFSSWRSLFNTRNRSSGSEEDEEEPDEPVVRAEDQEL